MHAHRYTLTYTHHTNYTILNLSFSWSLSECEGLPAFIRLNYRGTDFMTRILFYSSH